MEFNAATTQENMQYTVFNRELKTRIRPSGKARGDATSAAYSCICEHWECRATLTQTLNSGNGKIPPIQLRESISEF